MRNLSSQVAELVRRARVLLKILYFSGDDIFFQISPGIKPLYDRDKTLVHLLVGEG